MAVLVVFLVSTEFEAEGKPDEVLRSVSASSFFRFCCSIAFNNYEDMSEIYLLLCFILANDISSRMSEINDSKIIRMTGPFAGLPTFLDCHLATSTKVLFYFDAFFPPTCDIINYLLVGFWQLCWIITDSISTSIPGNRLGGSLEGWFYDTRTGTFAQLRHRQLQEANK